MNGIEFYNKNREYPVLSLINENLSRVVSMFYDENTFGISYKDEERSTFGEQSISK